jgi:hypothetical protein
MAAWDLIELPCGSVMMVFGFLAVSQEVHGLGVLWW